MTKMNTTPAPPSWVTLNKTATCKGCGSPLHPGSRVWMYPTITRVYGSDCCEAGHFDAAAPRWFPGSEGTALKCLHRSRQCDLFDHATAKSAVFSSCFTEARFTRLLRTGPARASPQADTAKLAAIPARLRAAL